jgi:hypothetical protein
LSLQSGHPLLGHVLPDAKQRFPPPVTVREPQVLTNRRSSRATLALFTAGLVALLACGDDDSAPPTAPYVPECERNDTAYLSFRNDSSVVYEVWLDGLLVVPSLSPGQVSSKVTVAAGVQHSVVFRNKATGMDVCFASPIPARCSDRGIYCDLE